MGVLRFGEVWFRVYPQDHEPVHIHGFIGSGEVIIELRADRIVDLARRTDAIRGRVKKNEIRRALETAANHYDELRDEWEKMHG